MYTLPPIEHIRRDLTAYLFGLANVLDRCVRPGAGRQMLNLDASGDFDFPQYDDFDLSFFLPAHGLEAVYRYAVFGEHYPGDERLSIDPDEGSLGRMQALVLTFAANPQISYCLDDVTSLDRPDAPRGGFPEMVALAVARATLDELHDFKIELTLAQVALLAQVSERTVANAMAMKGDSRLVTSRDEQGCTVVTSDEANRWLSGRRAFLKSVSVQVFEPLPEVVSPQELAKFMTTRIYEHVSDDGWDFATLREGGGLHMIPGQRIAQIARHLNWPEPRAQAWVDGGVDALELDDCPAAANLLRVDPQWLTRQIMNIRFPDVENRIEVELTEAGIANGYFDIEQRFARRFFPEDSFGGRGSDEVGKPIRLQVDAKIHATDIRVKSQALVSPRKRFTAYFKSHQAQPGDKVCITRTGERHFELSFIGQ